MHISFSTNYAEKIALILVLWSCKGFVVMQNCDNMSREVDVCW